MRKFLLIAYSHPPHSGIGSVRPGGLEKYLPLFGWEPIVLTVKNPAREHLQPGLIEIDYRSIREICKQKIGWEGDQSALRRLETLTLAKVNPCLRGFLLGLLRFGNSLTNYPDEVRGWIAPACSAIVDLRRKHRIAAVVSTGPPVSGHLIARRAKTTLGCPWVADLRDPWADNPHMSHGRTRRMLERRLEKKTLVEADAVVAVSPGWVGPLRQRYLHKPVHWIPNGFDTDDFPIEPCRLSKEFSITYTGTFYGQRRNPELLFKVIKELLDEGVLSQSSTLIHFYGPIEHWLPAMIQRCGLPGVVKLHGVVPRSAALEAQRKSQLLLLLRWDHLDESGFIPGKLFEYFGSRRPILALGGPPGAAPELLEETRSGTHVVSREQLRAFLLAAHASFRHSGGVSYMGDEAAIMRYTHLEMARKFAEVLDRPQRV